MAGDNSTAPSDNVTAAHAETLQQVGSEKIQEQFVEEAEYELNRIDLDKLSREAFSWKSRAGLRIIFCIIVQGLSTAAYGIDGSVTSGLAALPAFRSEFNVGTSGAGIAIIVSAMSIGNAAASLFQWLSDIIGRRGVTFLGNAIMVIGVVLQAASGNNVCFIMGRVFAGVGASLTANVGPLYMNEIAPAGCRAMVVGIYVSGYYIGGIVIACALLGGSYLPGNWSWRMPILLQLGPSILVMLLVYLITPESPRYLVARGKVDKARQVIARLHTTTDDVDEPIVSAEIKQIQDSLERLDNNPWDFSTFWSSRSGRKRLWIIFLYSLFQQWNGTGLLTAYLPAVLELVNITNSHQQLAINLGQSALAFVSILIGSTFVDRIRRRYLLLGSIALYILFFGFMSLFSGLFSAGIAQHATGILIVVTIYLFNMCTGMFVSIVHNVYPNELFHYRQRAKGMGIYSFFQNCFGFSVTYGGARALADLKWKVYFLFIGINILMLAGTWKFFPEFRRLSLEEIDLVMESDVDPVKMSLRLQKAKEEKREEERETPA
ncbi:sugar transporter (hexose transporter) [Pochonia chlamydosporia 170]|uniref:Sugar transporter (Hexose transporter) n=1 Tax=Pochonia chlamydosporia 170 TaxID=1380566 RepID=A0A179EXH0_METCM|nr:sugar transporter (hexose transporter) [Pochonia chlamydosporia 170]OAQ57868.1 sugar transporter (hexose transporter) [Pochonia chlamydosporia 170]